MAVLTVLLLLAVALDPGGAVVSVALGGAAIVAVFAGAGGRWPWVVSAGIGFAMTMCVFANAGRLVFAPLQAAGLVATALLAWWSMELDTGVPDDLATAGRWMLTAGLTGAGGVTAALVAYLSDVGPVGSIAEIGGPVALVAVALAVWAGARLLHGVHDRR